MTLALPDRWVWDFWLVEDEGVHHIFYLQAPRSLGDPDLRHWHASIGHAVSVDLVDWEVQPDALGPGPAGSWDDYTTWTGSVIAHEGSWHMFYTGTSRHEGGKVQRVGRAVSDDLISWRRQPPVLEAGGGYEKLSARVWHDEAWRDPWVVRHEEVFHCYVTARVDQGDPLARGVVGHLRSRDLVRWETLEPVTEPLGMGQLEVPQLIQIGERWYLVFCSDLDTQAGWRRRRGPGTGTYYLVGDGPDGPFRQIGEGVIEADRDGRTYAGRLHRLGDDLVFLAWNRIGPDGRFVGTINDPRRVRILDDGRLCLADP